MQLFNRAATRARKERRSDELVHTHVGDLSVYPTEVRRGAEVQPLTADTRAELDYTGSGGGMRASSFVTLVITGPRYVWRQRFNLVPDEKRAQRIADAVNEQAARQATR